MILIFFHLFTGPQFCQQDRHYEYLYFFPGDGGRGGGLTGNKESKDQGLINYKLFCFFLKVNGMIRWTIVIIVDK